MKTLLIVTTVLMAALIVLLLTLRINSSTEKAPGLVAGMLARCPSSPNCVCSMYRDDSEHYIEPINIPANVALDSLSVLKDAIHVMGGNVQTEAKGYLAATFTSALFKFVDDLEITSDPAQGLIHIRSASRVGYSDMGVNRKRVEQLKQLFNQKIAAATKKPS